MGGGHLFTLVDDSAPGWMDGRMDGAFFASLSRIDRFAHIACPRPPLPPPWTLVCVYLAWHGMRFFGARRRSRGVAWMVWYGMVWLVRLTSLPESGRPRRSGRTRVSWWWRGKGPRRTRTGGL